MVSCEHYEQISVGGDSDGTRRCAGVVARLFARFQSQEVHATSVVYMPGSEELSASRLPRCRCLFDRLSQPRGGHRTRSHSTLYDPSESCSSIADCAPRSAVVGDDGATSHETPQTCAMRGDRFHRFGIQSGQQLFCAAACCHGQPVEKHGLPPISQAGRTVSCRFARDLGQPQYAGPDARRDRLSTLVERSIASSASGQHFGRRRLRLRIQSPLRSRNLSRAHDHPCQTRSQDDQTGSWTLPTLDADPLRCSHLPPSLPGRNSGVDDQTAAGSFRPWRQLLEPMSRLAFESTYPQYNDPLASRGFLQSRTVLKSRGE